MTWPNTRLNQSKKRASRPRDSLLRPQQQRGQRRAQRQRVEGRDDDGDRDGHRELLIQPTRDAGDENRRDEYAVRISAIATTGPDTSSIALRRHRAGHPFLDMALDGLDDDDGVVHHQTDGQHQPE